MLSTFGSISAGVADVVVAVAGCDSGIAGSWPSSREENSIYPGMKMNRSTRAIVMVYPFLAGGEKAYFIYGKRWRQVHTGCTIDEERPAKLCLFPGIVQERTLGYWGRLGVADDGHGYAGIEFNP